jgi:acetoin utilization deacetylase AcuC-like enzyme
MTALLADRIAREHDPGPGHPEQPARFDAVLSGLAGPLTGVAPRAATVDELALCHGRGYIDLAKRDVASGAHSLSTGDTSIGPRSYDAALRGAGVVLNAVDLVLTGEASNAFCAVRPPGHHATPNRGMGFCLFNNIAVGARYAQRKHGVERVMIVDWDVHHGNGTQDIFYSDGSIFFFSTHQHPWYPGTGAHDEHGHGAGEGLTLNCPFPAGSGREEIVGAFRELLVPEAERFRPELVMISAGFDSRAGDPLGQFFLNDDDFGELTRIMLDIADKHAGGRLISVLEGGYNLSGLTAAVRAHTTSLKG